MGCLRSHVHRVGRQKPRRGIIKARTRHNECAADLVGDAGESVGDVCGGLLVPGGDVANCVVVVERVGGFVLTCAGHACYQATPLSGELVHEPAAAVEAAGGGCDAQLGCGRGLGGDEVTGERVDAAVRLVHCLKMNVFGLTVLGTGTYGTGQRRTVTESVRLGLQLGPARPAADDGHCVDLIANDK